MYAAISSLQISRKTPYVVIPRTTLNTKERNPSKKYRTVNMATAIIPVGKIYFARDRKIGL